MKLRSLPEDFRVEELASPVLEGGDFALYLLTKRSLGALEAVAAICRQWKLAREDVSIGGLKDRHAVTQQFATIRHGPRRNLTQTNLQLRYQGQTERPFESRDIVANRFRIVLRNLSDADVERQRAALDEAARDGLPNYFDDQRFGSVGRSGDFVGRAWCLGDFERALWLAAAEENDHDRPQDRDEKHTLREHWGKWNSCLPRLRDPLRRDIVACLSRRPHDFRGAFVRISAETRRLYLAAFQSFLWNRALAETLRDRLPADLLFEVRLGGAAAVFFRGLDAGQREPLRECPLPLPSSREKLEEGAMKDLYERIAGEFGLSLRTLRVKYPRDSFFSRGSRAAVFHPAGVAAEPAADELHPGRRSLLLRFDLPRGSYATVLVKRIALN